MNEIEQTPLTEQQCDTLHDNLYRRYVGEVISLLQKYPVMDVARDELMIRVVDTSLDELRSRPDDDDGEIEAADVMIDRLKYIDGESFLCEYTGTNFNLDDYVEQFDETEDDEASDELDIQRIPGTESSLTIRLDGLHRTPWTGLFNMYSIMKLARHAARIIESGAPAEEFAPFWIENLEDDGWEKDFSAAERELRDSPAQ